MKFNKFVILAGVVVGVYLAGKVSGAKLGAKAVLDKYTDVIPDDTFTVKVIDNMACTVTTVAKKGK